MIAPQSNSLRRRHYRHRARQDSGSSGVTPQDNPDVDDDDDDSSSPDDVDNDIADEVVASILSSQAIEYSKSVFGDSSTSTLESSSTSSTIEAVQTTTSSSSSTSSTPQVTSSSSTSTVPPTSSARSTTSSSAATTSASAAASNDQASQKKGASPAVIGVVVTLMLLMAAAAALFFIRRRFIRKRQAKRATWNAQPYTEKNADVNVEEFVEKDDGSNDHSDHFQDMDANEKKGPTPIEYPFAIGAQGSTAGQHQEHIQQLPLSRGAPMPALDLPQPPPPLHPSGFAAFRAPSPPPMEESQDYTPAPVGFDGPALGTNPQVVSFTAFSSVANTPSSVLAPGLAFNNSPGASADPTRRHTGTLLTVVRTFMPSLPDELPVQPGEQVRLIEKYDDGWAFCERLRGGAGTESGVVPIECLEGLPQDPNSASPAHAENIGVSLTGQGMGMVQERVESWRLSKRRSSLHPVGAGKY